MPATKLAIMGLITLALATAAGGYLVSRRSRPPLPAASTLHPTAPSTSIRFLPLGDSYTIGLGIEPADRWPNQLIVRLIGQGKTAKLLANPAVSGYTTAELTKYELPVLKKHRPNLVSLLIGTNDIALLGDLERYEQEYRYVVAEISAQLPSDGRLLLLTLPNYTAAPAGAALPPALRTDRAKLIKAYNQVIRQVARDNNLTVVDTYQLSTKLGADTDMYISDGFHPSGKQYALWANEVLTLISTP